MKTLVTQQLTNARVGNREDVAKLRVEGLGRVAGQLEVLRLVLADGHKRRLVQQNVGGLEDGVSQQAETKVRLGHLVL